MPAYVTGSVYTAWYPYIQRDDQYTLIDQSSQNRVINWLAKIFYATRYSELYSYIAHTYAHTYQI